MTKSLCDTDALTEHEFDIPCRAMADGQPQCETPAAWMAWSAHAQGECGMTCALCDHHKDIITMIWKSVITNYPSKCPQCGGRMSRLLSDNLKFTPL